MDMAEPAALHDRAPSVSNTQGELTSQTVSPRYVRHFVWYYMAQCVELSGEDLSCSLSNIHSVGL